MRPDLYNEIIYSEYVSYRQACVFLLLCSTGSEGASEGVETLLNRHLRRDTAVVTARGPFWKLIWRLQSTPLVDHLPSYEIQHPSWHRFELSDQIIFLVTSTFGVLYHCLTLPFTALLHLCLILILKMKMSRDVHSFSCVQVV